MPYTYAAVYTKSWDSWAESAELYSTYGELSFSIEPSVSGVVCGIGPDGLTTNAEYSEIEIGFYVSGNKYCVIKRGNFATIDTFFLETKKFSIKVTDGGVVLYVDDVQVYTLNTDFVIDHSEYRLYAAMIGFDDKVYDAAFASIPTYADIAATIGRFACSADADSLSKINAVIPTFEVISISSLENTEATLFSKLAPMCSELSAESVTRIAAFTAPVFMQSAAIDSGSSYIFSETPRLGVEAIADSDTCLVNASIVELSSSIEALDLTDAIVSVTMPLIECLATDSSTVCLIEIGAFATDIYCENPHCSISAIISGLNCIATDMEGMNFISSESEALKSSLYVLPDGSSIARLESVLAGFSVSAGDWNAKIQSSLSAPRLESYVESSSFSVAIIESSLAGLSVESGTWHAEIESSMPGISMYAEAVSQDTIFAKLNGFISKSVACSPGEESNTPGFVESSIPAFSLKSTDFDFSFGATDVFIQLAPYYTTGYAVDPIVVDITMPTIVSAGLASDAPGDAIIATELPPFLMMQDYSPDFYLVSTVFKPRMKLSAIGNACIVGAIAEISGDAYCRPGSWASVQTVGTLFKLEGSLSTGAAIQDIDLFFIIDGSLLAVSHNPVFVSGSIGFDLGGVLTCGSSVKARAFELHGELSASLIEPVSILADMLFEVSGEINVTGVVSGDIVCDRLFEIGGSLLSTSESAMIYAETIFELAGEILTGEILSASIAGRIIQNLTGEMSSLSMSASIISYNALGEYALFKISGGAMGFESKRYVRLVFKNDKVTV